MGNTKALWRSVDNSGTRVELLPYRQNCGSERYSMFAIASTLSDHEHCTDVVQGLGLSI
jgi:hypothetical protein